MEKTIVVVGSSNTDMIIQTELIPSPGQTVLGGRFSTAAGGKGANQAVAAARAGGRVALVARLGRDAFGDRAMEGFAADGIDTRYVVRDDREPSGVASIIVDSRGENAITVAPGANGRMSAADVGAAQEVIGKAAVVILQLEVPMEAVVRAAQLGRQAGAAVILNPAPAQDLPAQLLANVTILTPNAVEARMLTGIEVSSDATAMQAAQKLHDRGVETVLITRGAEGVYVSCAEYRGHVQAFDVEPVDTTAAGDVFTGVLAVGLAEGRGIREAVRFAAGAAALSVTKLGAQTSAPTREQIETFLWDKP